MKSTLPILLCLVLALVLPSAIVQCENVCPCNRVYLPVCGLDRVTKQPITYANKCILRCERARKIYDGPCKKRNYH